MYNRNQKPCCEAVPQNRYQERKHPYRTQQENAPYINGTRRVIALVHAKVADDRLPACDKIWCLCQTTPLVPVDHVWDDVTLVKSTLKNWMVSIVTPLVDAPKLQEGRLPLLNLPEAMPTQKNTRVLFQQMSCPSLHRHKGPFRMVIGIASIFRGSITPAFSAIAWSVLQAFFWLFLTVESRCRRSCQPESRA